MSDEKINAPTTPNKVINRSLYFVGTKVSVRFKGDCFKQEKITFIHGKIVNIYIIYEMEKVLT